MSVTGLTTVVIPCFNQVEFLTEAINSVLAQTAPIQLVVVNDGSTDNRADWDELRGFARSTAGVRIIDTPNQGVAAARNVGIAMARGEYIMFLDADDTIEPTKVAEQMSAFRQDVGWVLCDVAIHHDNGTEYNASRDYGYDRMALTGNIATLLDKRNFIPVMSPLIRTAAMGSIRFPAGKLEDWAFMRSMAEVANVAYVPQVLATYHRKRGSRHRQK